MDQRVKAPVVLMALIYAILIIASIFSQSYSEFRLIKRAEFRSDVSLLIGYFRHFEGVVGYRSF